MDGMDLVKKQCKIYELEYIFRKVTWSSSVGQNHWPTLFIKMYTSESLKFNSCQQICK